MRTLELAGALCHGGEGGIMPQVVDANTQNNYGTVPIIVWCENILSANYNISWLFKFQAGQFLKFETLSLPHFKLAVSYLKRECRLKLLKIINKSCTKGFHGVFDWYNP